QGDGVLGGSNGVALGRVDDNDPALGGCLEVDIVNANARTADDGELCPGFDDGPCHLGLAAYYERAVLGDDGDEGVFMEARPDVDFAGGAKALDAFRC